MQNRRKYLDKCHMDIVYGDCLSFCSFRYALLIINVATCYCWLFVLQSLTSPHIIAELEAFCADDGGLLWKFHTDFDRKLMGGAALRWINTKKSKIIAANAGRQSSNGLVKRTWRT